MNFKEWDVIDLLDFQGIIIDLTKWEDGIYTVLFNYLCHPENPDDENEKNSGFTICTQMSGSSVLEVYEKLNTVIEAGMFDGIEICAIGTIWDHEHNEIETINWNDFADEDDATDDEVVIDKLIGLTTTTIQ